MLPSNARCAVPCNAVVRCLMHCLALQALMKQRPFGDTNALLVVHQKIAEFNETQSIWYNYVKFYDMSNVDVTFARRSWKRKERIDNTKSHISLLPPMMSVSDLQVKAAIVGKRLCPERCNFLCVDAMEFLQTGVGPTPSVVWFCGFISFHEMFLFESKSSRSLRLLDDFTSLFAW